MRSSVWLGSDRTLDLMRLRTSRWSAVGESQVMFCGIFSVTHTKIPFDGAAIQT